MRKYLTAQFISLACILFEHGVFCLFLPLVESAQSAEVNAELHVDESRDLTEVTEIIEKTEISRETPPKKSTELSKLEKSEVLEKLAAVFAWDDSDEDSVKDDKNEVTMKRKEVKEKTLVKSKAKESDVDFNFDQFEKEDKDESDKENDVVKEEKIESVAAGKVQLEPEITLEVAKIDKEVKEDSVTETESEDDKAKDDKGLTEYTEEIFTEGETKVLKKTVTHQSHTATVVKGQPKITETVTVIREMSAPDAFEAITTSGESRHAEIQQYTTTVSGPDAQEKILKMKQIEIEGKAKEKEEETESPTEKLKETILKEIHKAEAEKPPAALEDKAVGPAGDASMMNRKETIQSIEEEAYATIKMRTGIDFSAGGDAVEIEDDESEEEEEEEALVTVKPELIPWSKEAPKPMNGTSEIQYVSDKTIRTEEMQLLDEVTVETKIMEVKTIKMELSHLGDVSVSETTEIKTDTDMSENRKMKEREETIYLHTKADKKQLKDRGGSPLAVTDKSGSDVESKDSKRERIPVLPKGTKLSDDWTPVHTQSSKKFSDWRDSKVQAAEAQRKSPSVTRESQEAESKELDESESKDIEEEFVKVEDVKKEYAAPGDKEPIKHTEIIHDPDDLDEGETYFCVAISTYDPESDEVLSLHEGEKVEVLDDTQDDWWLVRKSFSLHEGWVPGQYLREKAVYDRIVERQLKKAIDQLPSATSKILTVCTIAFNLASIYWLFAFEE